MEIVDIFDINWDWKYWRYTANNSIAMRNGDFDVFFTVWRIQIYFGN